MSEEELIATLQACYFGDRGAFNKILKEYKQLQQELTDYKEENRKLKETYKDAKSILGQNHRLKQELTDYKERNEKAVELLKENIFGIGYMEIDDLLKILDKKEGK